MPPYDNPLTAVYNYLNMDFGASAGATTHKIMGPAGMKGRLIELGIVTNEATVFATTLATFEVGVAANHDAYAKLNIATGVADNTIFNSKDDTDAIIDPDIPADTPVVVTLTEGTGGGLTGQGTPFVIINWFN